MLSFGNEGGAVQFFLFLDKLTGVSGNDCWEFGNKNRNSKGMENNHSQNSQKSFPNFGNGKGMKKSIPKIREREGNKKSIPTFRERESEAIIPGKSQERERKM